MIRAEYSERELRLQVRGHAGSADPGRDLICAAASALLLALREELLALEEAGRLSIRRLRLEPGLAEFACVPASRGEDGETAYDMAVRGLELLERLFRGYVEVERTDEDTHGGCFHPKG